MKVLYSQLKKYLPDLKASAKEVSQVYTKIGFMIDKLIEIRNNNGETDYVLDLEVRQNRADLFGVWGLAKELSAYYQISLVLPENKQIASTNNYSLPITIKAKDVVRRVMAIKINNIVIGESPAWLKDYLKQYDINSINNLVDLTNYAMLESAYPSHAFDADLVGDSLVWEINNDYKKITTLIGQEVEIPSNSLVISDGKKPLSLSFIGGKEDAISNNTKNIVLEMGIYDGGSVRRSSRQSKIMTEAGSRLEKFLDPESIPEAFNYLVSLILEHCGGEISSAIFDDYIQKTPEVEISVDLDKVQQIAGIPITYEESIGYLNLLGFEILEKKLPIIKVKRPKNRLDIEIEEDLFEEITRLKGFDNIPSNELSVVATHDITPLHLKIIDSLSVLLANNGFDEVRCWVLVDPEKNNKANYKDWEGILVTNSINEEVPVLRRSLAVSLLDQSATYEKNGIKHVSIFEIGKIFGKKDGKYLENNQLGLLSKDFDQLQNQTKLILENLGFESINFTKRTSNIPQDAHKKNIWNIEVNSDGKWIEIGIIYLTQGHNNVSLSEMDVDLVTSILNKKSASIEVEHKIVELDTNLELSTNESIVEKVTEKLKGQNPSTSKDYLPDVRHGEGQVWEWRIIDIFKVSDSIVRYTVRVTYYGLTDPEAKEIHSKIFE